MLSRHLTPLFPFLLLAEAAAVLFLWRSAKPLSRAAVLLIFAALSLSSLELRFAFRHSKDDYRSAAAAAIQGLQRGETVWWAAPSEAATYYRVPLTWSETPRAAQYVWGVWGYAPSLYGPLPDLIFFSKPDISDPDGIVASFLSANHYRCIATWQNIACWRKPASS
jgi:hypothetical protein